MEIREYLDETNKSPFKIWFDRLDARAAARVVTSLAKLELGNTSGVKSVGAGVYELRIDFGPGYRVYYGYDGATLVILLAGGTKKRQQADIDSAKACWAEYKKRKRS